ncbi:MAG TPA: tetratricopeptide repeat protein [Xanthomonadales bacterium]|nr:tetratricopeptide repeat protein [Xanthomonadales bacterium]
MMRNTKFWISMALFQVVFGLVIFALTRQYYTQEQDKVSAGPAVTSQPAPAWPDPAPGPTAATNPTEFMPVFPAEVTMDDPALIARQADDFFASQQYSEAANLYERLLALGFNDVNTYNNLGITLHYLGRSAEALSILDEGVALDSSYQRIWLTLGFVNSQLGNTAQARTALTTAVELNADSDVGRSAAKMLESLPPG